MLTPQAIHLRRERFAERGELARCKESLLHGFQHAPLDLFPADGASVPTGAAHHVIEAAQHVAPAQREPAPARRTDR